ncbi:unnamed protein product [Candida verbasci]|uniref:PPPDE domain-containing protein n=1 Tax=Candida verbasci TaxID=1227364 RepID=A0A9W4TYT9_9ASCO|nr:unnamed protein product [Candida verbasci]
MDQVEVYIYDLSHGLARVYSPMILGTSIDAIYHTSTIIRGKEIYIDHGIKITNVQNFHSKYGQPVEKLTIGTTEIDDELLLLFIEELKNHEDQKYHAINYDLFNNNCNHFTNVLIEFLCGKTLDDRILKLPDIVLQTEQGRMLQQLIGNQQLR